MLNMIGAFAATAAFVFLKAFQQLNIHYDKCALVWPFSLALTFAEAGVVVYLYAAVKAHHMHTVISAGIGAGAGTCCAMLSHKLTRR